MTSSLLISAVMADHIAKSFGDGTLPEFLTKYDVNEDGSIDEEERQAIKEERKAARAGRLARIDTDGDGKISSDERGLLREQSIAGRAEERELLRESLRKRIIAKRAEKFTGIAGDDGLLSLREMTDLKAFQNMSEERLASLFARLDTDNSGEVTLEEFNMRLRDHSSPQKPDSGN
ncbi:MAG: EF-hand domain-containing protein [Akkermansiaceae bacterium]|nr:EF-hand domain-containing protein [Akkermansiaceae bacterium]MDG1363389.1 EF-hand domain-containing protein [Akkermansiaceae bacterium]